MAKKGFNSEDIPGILSQMTSKEGWVLCVGAGISKPAFPNWSELVIRLIEKGGLNHGSASKIANSLLKEFSEDALIAGAFHKLELSPEDLSDALYRDFRGKFSETDWDEFSKMLADPTPGSWEEPLWNRFLGKLKAEWPGLSSYAIAEVVAGVIETPKAPRAVLSFNAEPLLYALLNAYARKQTTHNKKTFDNLIGATSGRTLGRIPYYFVHGLLSIPGLPSEKNNEVSNDKLVFSETEYLSLANYSYSWQSSVFINAASSHRVVFIGVSLSDPNMRRWLSWVHANRVSEIEQRNGKIPDSAWHYWLRESPENAEDKVWIEASVAHLGVRLVWMNDWSETGKTLNRMLS
jgi:hypothetical protein